ncbi:MAG: ACP S-malonyltransferase [Anaerovoracaceae bacterium]|nr:ACP S-malonyltransferase [Clostridiales bacterium]
MKAILLFSGQGAQYQGMGLSLYDNYKAAKAIFDEAGEEIKKWCFKGTKEELRETVITQPCIFTVTMAAYEGLMDRVKEENIDLEILGYAGFSLGEYSALTATGIIRDFSDGLDIVVKRGKMMQEAGLNEKGELFSGMAAAFGDRETILDLLELSRKDGVLNGSNFNSPIQTVVSGDYEALKRFQNAAKEKGIRVKMLSVSSAFHSPLMEEASEKLYNLLLGKDLSCTDKKVFSNVTGKEFPMDLSHEKACKEALVKIMALQVKSPVYWQETMENLLTLEPDIFIEIGPSTTLLGILKKIDESKASSNVEDKDSLERTIELLKKGID